MPIRPLICRVKAFVDFEIDLAGLVRSSAGDPPFDFSSVLGAEDASKFFKDVGPRRFFEGAHERDACEVEWLPG